MRERGVHHGLQGVPWVAPQILGRDRSAIDADPQRAVVIPRHRRDALDLLAHRLALLVVVQVPGVVTYLVGVARDFLRKPIVLLQVHGERYAGLPADLCERAGVVVAIDRYPNDGSTRPRKPLHLGNRRIYVRGAGGTHALHRHGRAAANHYAADARRSPGRPRTRFTSHLAVVCLHHV